MNSIFVQIASYRDKELVPTLRDIIAKAKYPEALTFGICWQHDETESLDEFLKDSRFKIINVDYRESKGCCWARYLTQRLYQGEDYTLQIDSHMRFVQDWDELVINTFKTTNHPKAIISYYPAPYEIVDGTVKLTEMDPQAIVFSRFESGFIPYYGSKLLQPNPHSDMRGLYGSEPGCFIAAGFLFTVGQFCLEVIYNPHIYFLGEETDIALRSFTKGYNVFHPYRNIAYHYFIRKGEPRHWEDHTSKNVEKKIVAEDYVTTTMKGFELLKTLLHEPNDSGLGMFAMGKIRTRRDFEMFTGINFKRQIIHPDSTKKIPPITDDPNWEEHVQPLVVYKETLKLDFSQIPDLDDYDFWYFGLHTAEHMELYRNDLRDSKYFTKKTNEVLVDAILDHKPITYTLWPHSISKGWIKKLTYNLS